MQLVSNKYCLVAIINLTLFLQYTQYHKFKIFDKEEKSISHMRNTNILFLNRNLIKTIYIFAKMSFLLKRTKQFIRFFL